jgi:hypothetical protein
MSIHKTLTDIGTDVPMDHHVVASANCQYDNNQTYVIVRSFFSQASYESGKRALAETPVMLMGVPPRGVEQLDWVQAQLVLPVDETVSTNTYVNRWQFSGGVVVDHAPQPDAPAAPETPAAAQTVGAATQVSAEASAATAAQSEQDATATQASATTGDSAVS